MKVEGRGGDRTSLGFLILGGFGDLGDREVAVLSEGFGLECEDDFWFGDSHFYEVVSDTCMIDIFHWHSAWLKDGPRLYLY